VGENALGFEFRVRQGLRLKVWDELEGGVQVGEKVLGFGFRVEAGARV
jgi:hypothetical protein